MIAVCILCGFIGGGMSLVGLMCLIKDVDSGNALGATETHDKKSVAEHKEHYEYFC